MVPHGAITNSFIIIIIICHNRCKKIALIKNWLGRTGLQLLEMLTEAEQEKCERSDELFQTQGNKFKLRYNETIK